MKKINYLLGSIFMVAALVSCEKESMNDNQLGLLGDKKGVIVTEVTESSPISAGDVTPYIIPGENKGGNRTCVEVGLEFMGDADYFTLCGDKIDYEEGSFEGEFPEELNVTTDGIFVSFEMDACFEIGGNYYKVGAVIVKGSAAANVYFYSNGTMSDSNLAAPINSSGDPAGLSNLTFCFVECEQVEELVIAVKCIYWDDLGTKHYGISSGISVFSEGWCNDWPLGINDYPATSSFNMNAPIVESKIGEVTVMNSEVTITLNTGFILDVSYLFIGTLEDLHNNLAWDGCPAYYSAPWEVNDTDGNSHTFTL